MIDYPEFTEGTPLPTGRTPPRKQLVVLLHAYKRPKRLDSIRRTVRQESPHADIFSPTLPYWNSRLCKVKAEAIVADLMDRIDCIVTERGQTGEPYEDIIFVGHSMGAVLARKLVIIAFGEQKDQNGFVPAPFEPELQKFIPARQWAPSIDRLVLMAGMNRGWSTSSAMDWFTSILWSGFQLFGEIVLRRKPTIFAIRRGAPFLVQTRLQWMALMHRQYGTPPDIMAVQLLGTRDDQVAPDDNVDYAVDQFQDSQGQAYCYIEVKHSGHGDVVEMDETNPPTPGPAERRAKFLLALNGSYNQVRAASISRDHMGDSLPPKPDEKVNDLVFVIHGIRDRGFWAQKIARNIKRHANANTKFESWTSSYGYFAMLPFLLKSVRQRKVEWLMDCYTEARARYPRARFHYVGHSNGTYLLAQALRDYPAVRFENVVFAGSVVRRDYKWSDWLSNDPYKRRVTRVLNYVATNDRVVALFPKGLQPWGANLGSAGHDGFDQADDTDSVRNIEYIVGSHGAGHQEEHWDAIARFITNGEWPRRQIPSYSDTQSRKARLLGYVAPGLFPLLILAVLGLGGALLWSFFAPVPQPVCNAFGWLDWLVSLLPWRESLWQPCAAQITAATTAWRGFFFVLYCWAVGLFVMRF